MMNTRTLLAIPKFARALQSRPFALLWAGQTISVLGDGAFFLAFVWQILLLTNSSTAIGLVEATQALPGLFFLLLGGVAADRLSRRSLLLWSDSGRAVVVMLLVGLIWLHLLRFWHVVILALIFGIVDGFFWPAYQAIPPQLVPSDDLASANGLTVLSQRLSLIVGPLLGTALIAWGSPAAAFVFDGLTFLVSALCLLAIRLPATAMMEEQTEKISQPKRLQAVKTVLGDMLAGFNFITGERWLWIGVVVGALSNLSLSAAFGAAEPRLVRDVYGAGAGLLGLLGATISAGVILATLLVGQLPSRKRRGILCYLGMLLLGLSLTVLGLPVARANPTVIAGLASIGYGFGMGFAGLLWTTLIQEHVPREKLGRVSSIEMFSTFGLIPIGLIAGGIVTDHIGASAVFIICGGLNVTLAIAALAVKDIRQLS